VGHGYSGDWVEYQANQCMAALLIPRRIFAQEVDVCLKEMSFGDVSEAILANQGRELWRWLANDFDLNERAILYRMKELGYIESGQQKRLGFA